MTNGSLKERIDAMAMTTGMLAGAPIKIKEPPKRKHSAGEARKAKRKQVKASRKKNRK